jgi:hypothetical protein
MGGLARDLKQDDTTDAGFDLLMDQVTSPVTADVGVTRIDVGTSTTYVPMDSSNPLYAQLTAGTAEIGKLAAGTAEIGNVKNAGTFVVQIDGDALTALQLIDNAISGAGFNITQLGGASVPIGAGTEAAAVRVTLPTDGTGKVTAAQATAANLNAQTVGNVASAATDSGNPVKIGGIFNTTQPTVTTGQRVNLQATNRGALIVASGVSNLGTNIAQMNGVSTTMGNGASGTGVQRVTIASDSTGQVKLATGTAAIGKLGANSGVDIGDVDVLTQPARDRLTDNVGVALQTDAIMDDTEALTPKFAKIDAASSGDNTLVAAVASRKIRVLSLFLQSAGTVNIRFEDGAGGTALTGQMNNVVNTGFVLPFNPVGWFETSATTLLNLELSAAVSVDGCLTYVEA